jgi:hypothetical protein
MKNLNSQPAKVLRYLNRHKTITPREALVDLGVYRLSDAIFKLRNRGWTITTSMRENPETGSQYGVYRLGVK